jgi:hypothetical protein
MNPSRECSTLARLWLLSAAALLPAALGCVVAPAGDGDPAQAVPELSASNSEALSLGDPDPGGGLNPGGGWNDPNDILTLRPTRSHSCGACERNDGKQYYCQNGGETCVCQINCVKDYYTRIPGWKSTFCFEEEELLTCS